MWCRRMGTRRQRGKKPEIVADGWVEGAVAESCSGKSMLMLWRETAEDVW